MYYFNHNELKLPVHPGDEVFILENHSGYAFHTMKVKTVCIFSDRLEVIFEDDGPEVRLEDSFFLTYDEMVRWTQDNIAMPPFTVFDDTFEWMDYSMWIPAASNSYYVKMITDSDPEIRKVYYLTYKDQPDHVPGFYESREPGASPVRNVAYWMNSFCSMEDAAAAGTYEPPFDLFGR